MKKVMVRHLLLILFILAVQSVFAQRTVRMNLERMISNAGIIVHGTVVKIESKNDQESNILSTFVTFEVKENFYGADQSTITIKMLGGSSKTRTMRLAEMPTFFVGEEFIGMFYTPSKLGFSSPVGMGQGKFTVTNDPTTNAAIARNSFNNKNLFVNSKYSNRLSKSVLVQSPETLPLADLSQSIRSLITILKK